MSNSSAFVRLGVSLWTAVASFASRADPPSFKISQIYSNLDGSTRFIRLTEAQGPTGQTANLLVIVASTRWVYLSVRLVAGGN